MDELIAHIKTIEAALRNLIAEFNAFRRRIEKLERKKTRK
jgi:hypothetical protein